MPHITIKCYPGRSEEQKRQLAEKITEAFVTTFNASAEHVSIALQEIVPADWDAQVWDPEIKPNMDSLLKKPEYQHD